MAGDSHLLGTILQDRSELILTKTVIVLARLLCTRFGTQVGLGGIHLIDDWENERIC